MTNTRHRAWVNGALVAAFVVFGTLSAITHAPGKPVPTGATLTAFKSDDDLRQFLKKHIKPQRAMMMDAAGGPPPPPMAAAQSTATETAAKAGGITNNQEAGVDEGDIVKMHGS